ncbi:MAG: hypothetical protein P4L71_19230 [Acetobacteraceae bacterium]|nr:hypothetical protein [Acetobacteraceae bacterium]
MRYAVLILLAGMLAGCVNQLAIRQAHLAQFVGRSEGELVQQMGVPNRTYETEGVKYLAYDEGGLQVLPPPPAYPYGPQFWAWYGGGWPPQVVNTLCETTFAVAQGVVRSFTLRGNACD